MYDEPEVETEEEQEDDGRPRSVREALEVLSDRYSRRTSNLHAAYEAWQEWGEETDSGFAEAVEEVTGWTVHFCEDCELPFFEGDLTDVGGRYETKYVCGLGCLDKYICCDRCDRFTDDTTTTVSGSEWCDNCRENYASYCEDCDEYYDCDDSDDHAHNCECEAPHLRFEFPFSSLEEPPVTIREDERVEVHLPKGTISDVGLHEIANYVMEHIDNDTRWQVRNIIADKVGPLWQAKRGNFTRRLSSALYQRGVKLDKNVIAQVGNLARQHASDGQAWWIELTRDLNQDAEYFYHDGSCWFSDGSYAISRCCLKQWGGLAIRTFSSERADSYHPTGRAWVQPLDANLRPTHDAVHAHAYVVYNGYGDLEGYIACRIVAQMTGKTYKKISFDADGQYVNGESGYLVSDETTCDSTEHIHLSADPHSTFDARTLTSINRRIA
jgi:hypothetical protein